MPKKAAQPSLADADSSPGGAAAVDRALSILGVFSAAQSVQSLAEIAEHTGLYKSTALRLLASLEHGKLVRRTEEGRYALGPEIARLYAGYSASFSLGAVVLPIMKRLVAETQESASLHVRQGEQRLVLCRVDSPQPVRDHIKAGDLLPLDKGVGAHVIMAFSGAIGKIYDEIRKKNLISLVGDRSEGVAGISAPVFGARQEFVGAITLTMPATRFQKKHEAVLRSAAIDMTKELGGSIHVFD